jgi:hypothetical protein
MGHGACLQSDYIEIDAEAWATARAGDPLEDLTDAFQCWEDTLAQQTTASLDGLALFIAARAGSDWLYAEDAVITVPPDTGDRSTPGHLSLSATLVVHRYTDPAYGPVAFIEILDSSGTGSWPGPTAHVDDGPEQAWHELAVRITCPAGHGWVLADDELVDELGDQTSGRPVGDLFPAGVVTTDTRVDVDTYGEPQIVCPTCASLCEVSLTDPVPDA